MTASDHDAAEHSLGTYVEQSQKPFPPGIGLQFVPSLVATLLHAQKSKGSPLTEPEVIAIRDRSPVVVASLESIHAVERRRNYTDIDFADPWPSWLRSLEEDCQPPLTVPEGAIEGVICIPGPWKSRQELADQIATICADYVYTGRRLVHIPTNSFVDLQYESHDPRMAEAFFVSGPHWQDSDEMARVADHSKVVYLIGPAGSPERTRTLMDAVAMIVRAGGVGVKCENSGLAHSPSMWLELCEGSCLLTAHRAFIAYPQGDETYTCGMHVLGHPDAIIETHLTEEPIQLLQEFTHYLYAEHPDIESGQAFRATADAPRYRITEEHASLYDEGSLFNNPFGMWRLTPVE